MIKNRILQLLQEKPRTVDELSKILNRSELHIKWHLLPLPVAEHQDNGRTYIFLTGNGEVDNSGPHDIGDVNSAVDNHQNPFSFSLASSFSPSAPSPEQIKQICSICDKDREHECPLCSLHDTCKVDNHNQDKSSKQKKHSKASNRKTKKTYQHISSKRKNHKATKTTTRKKQINRGLQIEVYNQDHRWLTKPLTLEDYAILHSLTYKQRVILKLLHHGKTQAQIANNLKITRQAVYKHVKKFIKLDFIMKNGSLNGTRDITYDVRKAIVAYLKLGNKPASQDGKPQNRRGDTSPQKSLFTIHRLQLAFHIVNQSQPFTTSCQSFVKVYNPRGWTGYIYLIGNVRIRALPRKVIAEFTDDFQPLEGEKAEEATIRAIEHLKLAIQGWIIEQSSYGVDVELSHPYIMNTPEYAFRSKIIKQYINKLREERQTATLMHNGGVVEPYKIDVTEDIRIDDSPRENGEDAEAHLETNNPDTVNQVDIALKNALNLPTYLDRYFKPMQQEIQIVKSIVEAGMPVHQRMDQLMGIIGHLLKESAFLRQELTSLRQELTSLGGNSPP